MHWLDCGPGVYLDVTLGDAGHSVALLEKYPTISLIGTDRDINAINESKERLKSFGDRIKIFNARFSEIPKILENNSIDQLSGVIADLGVSSRQIDEGDRGFSFQQDGPLDMRMGRSKTLARDIVNSWPEKDLADLFYEYGEERKSRRIAKQICIQRKKKKFETTADLSDFISKILPKSGKINPATKTFQALRIAVNAELEELNSLLNEMPLKLKNGGHLVIISYHSLEDRMAKKSFKEWSKSNYRLPFKKPLIPSKDEIATNRRSRSAKMRVLERAA